MKNYYLSVDIGASGGRHILSALENGMQKCSELGKIPESVSIDTWGVDFVLLDEDTAIGNLMCQMIEDKQFADLAEARRCVMDSFAVNIY